MPNRKEIVWNFTKEDFGTREMLRAATGTPVLVLLEQIDGVTTGTVSVVSKAHIEALRDACIDVLNNTAPVVTPAVPPVPVALP